jgi:hypothetical protein
MNYVIVGYYTRNTLYEEKARVLIQSMERFEIPHDIVAIDSFGTWWQNTGYKPTFLLEMLDKHSPTSIVYVDCDAEFMRYPDLFDTLDCDVGVYVFDRSCYTRSHKGTEVLSGTIFLKSNTKVRALLEKWIRACRASPKVWDQKLLEKVLEGQFFTLPGEYCKIFDRMDHITNPVIVHYQASREVRKMNREMRV